MTIKEQKKAVQRLGKALESLPPDKRQYMLGYADGVLAAKERAEEVEKWQR